MVGPALALGSLDICLNFFCQFHCVTLAWSRTEIDTHDNGCTFFDVMFRCLLAAYVTSTSCPRYMLLVCILFHCLGRENCIHRQARCCFRNVNIYMPRAKAPSTQILLSTPRGFVRHSVATRASKYCNSSSVSISLCRRVSVTRAHFLSAGSRLLCSLVEASEDLYRLLSGEFFLKRICGMHLRYHIDLM